MLTIILALVLISLIFAPLGCISLWKRYIYFGDGLAHASLLAGGISIVAGLPIFLSGLIIAIIFAILVFYLKDTSDNNLAVSLVSSLMLATALIIAHLNPASVNINNLLFGDIISANNEDILILTIALALVVSLIIIFHQKILIIALNRDIAKTLGIRVVEIELLFLIVLSLAILATIKIAGSLLVTSILLIPAMSARVVARTPLQMIIVAVVISLACNLLGAYASLLLDIPVAAAIIVNNCLVYFLVKLLYPQATN